MHGISPVRGRGRPLVVLACLAALATGCSSDAEGDPEPPSSPALLSMAVYGPEPVVTAYTSIAARYSSENPNTSVSIEPYPDAASARAAITEQLADGSAPDLFLTPVEALPQLDEAGAIREVGSLLLDRDLDFGDGYQRYALEAFSSDSSLQCMPVDASPLVVYYNTALVDLATVNTEVEPEVTPETGWSFDQFEVAAREPRPDDVHGLYIDSSLDQLAPFIFSGGGSLVDDDQEPTRLNLSDGSTRDALEQVLPLFRDPVVNFSRAEIEEVPGLQRFKDGQVAMLLGFRSLTPELRAVADLSFDVMPLPRVGSAATIGEASGLCISAASTQVDPAADFLAYLVSDPSMSLLAETGYVVPTNNDTAHTGAFLQAGQEPVSATVFTDQIRAIKALPAVPQWPGVVRGTSALISSLLYDPLIASVEERLQAIDRASEPLFGPAGASTPGLGSSSP